LIWTEYCCAEIFLPITFNYQVTIKYQANIKITKNFINLETKKQKKEDEH